MWAARGSKVKTPSKHSTSRSTPWKRARQGEREAGSQKIRQQEGWVRSVLTMIFEVPL